MNITYIYTITTCRGWNEADKMTIFVSNSKWKADEAAKAEDVGASVLQRPVRPVAKNTPLCFEGATKKKNNFKRKNKSNLFNFTCS